MTESSGSGGSAARRAAAAGAILALAATVFSLRSCRSSEEPARLADPGSVPPPPVAVLPPPAEPEENRLYDRSAERDVSDKEALDWLMDLFSESKKDPEAKAKADAFRAEAFEQPAIKEKLREFKALPPARRAEAKKLLREIARMSEFKSLVARFGASGPAGASTQASWAFLVSGKPGAASGLAAALAKIPGVPGPKSPAWRAGFLLPPDARAGDPRRGAVSSVLSGHGTSPGAAADGRADLHAKAATAQPPSSQGPGAHDVAPKLDAAWLAKTTAGKSEDGKKIERLLKVHPCLQSLGEETVARFIHSSSIDSVGLWGACFELGLYGACEDSRCSKLRSFGCWQACLDTGDSPLGCIGKVGAQPGCSLPKDIPPDVWKEYCVARQGPKGPLPPPPPYPECGGGGAAPPPPAASAGAGANSTRISYRDPTTDKLCHADYLAGKTVRDVTPGCNPPLLGLLIWRQFPDGTWSSFFNGQEPPPQDKPQTTREVMGGVCDYCRKNLKMPGCEHAAECRGLAD